ncbi:MAG: translocation/assembly module TamB domain-containing protein [Paraglaciecola polaris]|uniref:autotransporter assembly complex protein TamB n=1 Tax=Paraglaciecola polaris TaxID=222814 RepID=UPI003001BD97
MKWLKYVGVFFAVLVLLVALVASPWGTRGVLSIADSSLEALDIDYDAGSLLSELSLNRLTFVTPELNLQVRKLTIDVNWSCVATMQACLSKLSAQSIGVKVIASETPAPANNEPLKRITLPIPVSIEELDIRNIRVDVENTLDLNVQALSTKLSMYRTLRLDHLTLDGIRVVLPPGDANTSVNASPGIDLQSIANWQYTPLQLPPIIFPIVMNAKNVAVNDVLVTQNKQAIFDLTQLRAAIDITPKLLTVKSLHMSSSLGEVDLTASLSKQWQHQLHLMVKSHASSSYSIDGTMNLKGNLQRSELTLDTSGFVTLKAVASADLQSKQLPLSLEVNWQPITWPVTKPQIFVDKGHVSLSGNVNEYQLALDTAIKGGSIPQSALVLCASGNTRHVQIANLAIDTLGGRVEAVGDVTVDSLAKWQSVVTFNDIQPQQFWPQLEANIKGKVSLDGQYDGKDVSAHMRELVASGDWLDYQLSASGEVNFDSVQGIEIPELHLQTGDNKLTVSGTLEAFEDVQAQLTIDAKDLSQLYPSFAGNAQLDAQVDGTVSAPEISFNGSGNGISLPEVSIAQLSSKGQVIWDVDKQVEIELQLTDGIFSQQPVANVNLALSGDAQQHQLSLSLNSAQADIVTKLHGSLAETQWNGRLDVATIAMDAGQFSLEEDGPEISADWAKNAYRISPFCLVDNEAHVCINRGEYQTNDAQFDIAINDLPLSPLLSANLPELQKIDTDAKLTLVAKGQWDTKGLPVVEANMTLTPSTWTVEGTESPLQLDTLTMQVNTRTAEDTQAQYVQTKLLLASQQLGGLNSQLDIQVDGDSKPISGELVIDNLTLGAMAQFVPQLSELTGHINGQIGFSGDLTSPLLNGQVKLEEGAFAGPILPSRINQVEQVIAFEGKAASLSGPFKLGNGKGQIDGQFSWQDEPSAVVNVKGTEMEIDYQNIVRAKLSPDVNVAFSSSGLVVKGEVTLPYARIKVRELPPSALSPSNDVVLVNHEQAIVESKTPLELSLQINIDPKKNNDVKIDAFGLTSDLEGALLLTQSGEVLNANGELNLINGRYRAYGQDLVIREGEIQFSGPIDSPYLVVEAIRDPEKTADEVIAGLRIEGSALQPKVSVFSDPSMEQPEALSYLLRGTAIDSGGETSSDAALASALIGFGLGKSENKVSNIGRKLGVEDLALNTTGAGDDTKLSVSGYIAPGVQLRYGVGVFDSVSEVALRYQLMPKLYLEAVSGLNSALDLYYQFTLDDDKKSKPE